MIKKKELQKQIDALSSISKQIDATNKEEFTILAERIDAIAEYLNCEFTVEKSIKQTVDFEKSHWGKIFYKDYIKKTTKLVKKTKKNK